MKRRHCVVGALAGAVSWAADAQVPAWSLEAQQRLIGGPQAAAAPRLAEIQRLIETGEAALVAGDPAAAEAAFDAAAMIIHSADVELGLVRAYMQAGDYRRALTFASHAAGAHRQVPGATALYGWLLRIGGQGVAAQRFIGDALLSFPLDPALQTAQALLQSQRGRPGGPLLDVPLRAAPYASGATPGAGAEALCSAVLTAGGREALAPAELMGAAGRLWVRNGMGHTRAATRLGVADASGLCRLQLDQALPDAPGLAPLTREPFAGSPAYTIEFAPSADAMPAWPVLQQGFFGRGAGAGQPQPLGIDASTGPRGGPVFDALGRLAGVALARPGRSDVVVPVPTPALGTAGAPPPAASAPARLGVDALYETGLRLALQVLRLA